MKLIRLFAPGSLGLLTFALAGCLVEPTFSTTPDISLNNTKAELTTDSNGDRYRHLEVTINYQDGDGDLGLTEDEAKKAPYFNTRFASNFFFEPYVRNGNGVYIPLADANRVTGYVAGRYNQRFEHATAAADNQSIPIKGTLTLKYDFFIGDPFPARGETVEFHVSIADRARHESNVLVVPVTFPN